EILVPEGETVDVGTVIAIIATEADAEADAGEPVVDEGGAAAEEPESMAEVPAEEDAGQEPAAESVATEEEPHLDVRPSAEGGVEVVMPKMGESITEGTIITWHKKEGDTIEEDEILLEIATDKV